MHASQANAMRALRAAEVGDTIDFCSTAEGFFHGTIVDKDDKLQNFTITRVMSSANFRGPRKHLPGNITFRFHDVSLVNKVDSQLVKKVRNSMKLMRPHQKPEHLLHQDEVPADTELVQMAGKSLTVRSPQPLEIQSSSVVEANNSINACAASKAVSYAAFIRTNSSNIYSAALREKSARKKPLPQHFECFKVVQDTETLKAALENLSKERIVTLAAEGVNMSRFGEISWIAVGTANAVVELNENFVYLFDIQLLGPKVFVVGLKSILESETVLKVAKVQVERNRTLLLNKYVASLRELLRQYLLVELPLHFKREGFREEDQRMWTVRPLSVELQQLLVSYVLYLPKLRRILMQELMGEFNECVSLYCNFRDAKHGSVDNLVRNPDRLHRHFISTREGFDRKKSMLCERLKNKDISHFDRNTNLLHEIGPAVQPGIRFCRDTWHRLKATTQNTADDDDTFADELAEQLNFDDFNELLFSCVDENDVSTKSNSNSETTSDVNTAKANSNIDVTRTESSCAGFNANNSNGVQNCDSESKTVDVKGTELKKEQQPARRLMGMGRGAPLFK